MIVLHNLHGEEFALNAELIERVEGQNETHILLVTGTAYVVGESTEEVIRLHRLDRAEVAVLAGQVRQQIVDTETPPPASPLRLLNPPGEKGERP